MSDQPLNIPGGTYTPTETTFVEDSIGQQWATSMSDVRLRPVFRRPPERRPCNSVLRPGLRGTRIRSGASNVRARLLRPVFR